MLTEYLCDMDAACQVEPGEQTESEELDRKLAASLEGFTDEGYWAPDVYMSGNCTQTTCPYSLSDFFGNFSTVHTFQPISLPNNYTQYTADWFENFSGTPTDPDDDAIDPSNN
jgi:hypothetical protein